MRIVSGNTTKYIYFVAVDSVDLKTRETGLSSFTVYRSRNGGAAASYTTPTINETDSTNMPGVYELLLDEDMTIDTGDQSQEVCLHITHAGMAPVTRTFELYRPSVTAGETLSVSGGLGNAAVQVMAPDTITASAIAADAIGASELAADAVAEIADAVWDEDATAHQTGGTFGQAIGDPGADTNTIFKAVVTDASGATVGVDTTAIKTKTDFLPSATAGSAGGVFIAGSNAATTFATMTVTGATTLTGNVALADGLTIAAPSTLNRSGLTITGNGTGEAIELTGGATGGGMTIIAGGGTNSGIYIQAGDNGDGIEIVGGGTSGEGVSINANVSGHGLSITASGASKHGILVTGGSSGTSDGINAVAGVGGVPIRGDITGNITGNVSGSVGSVTGAVGSVTGAVGSVAAGGITAASIATNAVDADALAADAVTEIVSGVLTTAMTEAYAADGVAPTLAQALFAIQQFLQEKAISGTTLTVNKLDGTTAAMTFTLDSATAPTSVTRAT